MIKKILPLIGALAVAPFLGAAEDNAGVPATLPESQTVKASEFSAEKKALFLKIAGCYFAAQNGLEFAEFTPEETAALVEGFKLGIQGKLKDMEADVRANDAAFTAFMQGLMGKINENAQAASLAEMQKLIAKNKADGAAYIEKCKEDKAYKQLDSGVLMKVENAGDEKVKPTPESYLTVRYTGKFINGTIFDSSLRDSETGEPKQFTPDSEPAAFPFPLNGLIPGWIEAFQLLGKGAKATLVIPSDQAYGDQPGQLPPGSTLVFDVELVDVSDKAPEQPALELDSED